MVCQAVGRCRICARKHKLPIFGSEENQHALFKKVNLQLIVLNTVCMDCIEKLEQCVKEKNSIVNLNNVALQHKPITNSECNETVSKSAMQFYVEFGDNSCTRVSSVYESSNIKLSDKDSINNEQKTVPIQPSKSQCREEQTERLTIETDASELSPKVRGKRKVQSYLCCDFCEKEFTHRGDFKRHKRKHTGEQPYECVECQKKFSQLSNLARHRLVHSGERPFVCTKCGQSYSRKGRLINHIDRELCGRKHRSATDL